MLSHIEVVTFCLSPYCVIAGVELLEFPGVGKSSHALSSAQENFGLFYTKVKSQLTVRSQKIVLDVGGEILLSLNLHLFEVGQLKLSHGKAVWHAQLPLDLI